MPEQYSLVVVEKFRKGTDVRVLSTGTHEVLSRQHRETKWVGKRGQPYIIPSEEVESFSQQHRTGIFVPSYTPPTQAERTEEYERKKRQEAFERERETAKQPTEEGETARALLKTKYGIEAPTPSPEKVTEPTTAEQFQELQEKIQEPVYTTTLGEFASSIFSKQGYDVDTREGDVVSATKGQEQIIAHPTTEFVTIKAKDRDITREEAEKTKFHPEFTHTKPSGEFTLKGEPIYDSPLGTGEMKTGLGKIWFDTKEIYGKVERKFSIDLSGETKQKIRKASQQTTAAQIIWQKKAADVFFPKGTEKIFSKQTDFLETSFKAQQKVQPGLMTSAATYTIEHPVETGLMVAGGAAFGTVGMIASKSARAARIFKGTSYGLGALYAGAKSYEVATTPGLEKKGEVLGTIPVELAAFGAGAKLPGIAKSAALSFKEVHLRFATKPRVAVRTTDQGKTAAVEPVEFAAKMGKEKFAGEGMGAVEIYGTDQIAFTKGTFKYELTQYKFPQRDIKAEAIVKGALKQTDIGFEGKAIIRTTTTVDGKSALSKSISATKGVQLKGDSLFPVTVTKTAVYHPYLPFRATEGRVGVVKKTAEVTRPEIFRHELEFTPEEYGKILVDRGELSGIYTTSLKKEKALGLYYHAFRGEKPFIELDSNLPKTKFMAFLRLLGSSGTETRVLEHEIWHHLHKIRPGEKEGYTKFFGRPKSYEKRIIKMEKESGKKPFKDVVVKEQDVKIELFEGLEKGASAKFFEEKAEPYFATDTFLKKLETSRLLRQKKGQLLMGKEKPLETLRQKPEITKEKPGNDILDNFETGLKDAIRGTLRARIPKGRTTPISKSKTRVGIEPGLKEFPGLKDRTRVGIEPGLKEVIGLKDRTRITPPGFKLGTKQGTRQRLRTDQIFKATRDPSQDFKIGVPGTPPPPPPPPPPPLKFGLMDKKKKKKGMGIATSREFRYTPSFTAIALGIKGKVPKDVKLTGLEIRPIPKGIKL
mgnify:CR=1 FL=1